MKYLKSFDSSNFKNEDIITNALLCDINSLKKLIESGVDVNFQDEWGNTALIAISDFNRPDIVKLLLNFNANPDIINKFGENALIVSAKRNNIKNIELLIDANANWLIKKDDKYFIDFLDDVQPGILRTQNKYVENSKKYIINKYPEKYKELLKYKEIEKYNL